jgi:CheY-like chemotaxis protein
MSSSNSIDQLQKENKKLSEEIKELKQLLTDIEDDEHVRKFAYTALKSFGYNLIEAQNGKISIDIIVTDLIMPKMNGQEFVSILHTFLPDIKVLYVSGYTFEYLSKDGEIEESINFLQKPYTIQNILKKIRGALDN